jgi:drug/metabolite transporter (DMT)-like permease
MPEPGRHHTSVARLWLALGAVYVIWSTTFVGIKVTNQTLPPLLAGGMRFLVAGVVLLAISWPAGDRTGDRPRAAQWKGAGVVGLLMMFGGNGGIVWAERTIDSHVAGLAIATVPLWIALIDRVVLHRRQSRRVTVGLAVGFAGAASLIGAGTTGGRIDPGGLLLALAAAASWAAGSVYQRHANLPQRSLLAAGMEMVLAGGFFVIGSLAAGELGAIDPSRFSRASVLALAYLIVFGSWIGFTAYLWLLRSARTSLVSTYAYVTPVGAVFVGWLLLGERPDLVSLGAGALIVVSVVLIVTAGGAARDSDAGQERRPEIQAEV